LSLTPHTIQLPRIHTIRNVSELDAANTDDVYHLVLDEAIDVSEYVVKDIDIYLDVADQMRATQENTSMDLLESATMINIPTAFHQYVQRSCPNPVTQQFSQHLFDHRAVITSSTQPIPMVLEMLNHSCSNS